MTSKFKRYRHTEMLSPEGVPYNVDDYADWFNQNFTFAKARVLRDGSGRKFIDLVYNT